jgi:hypothetical protein
LEEPAKELEAYTKELFEQYVTSEYYKEFPNIYGFHYLLTAYWSEYELQVNKIDIEKTDSDEDIYDFTIELQYQKLNEEPETEVITGQANMNDEHKMERFDIRDNGFLESVI